jgi:hypothetical protein
VGAACIDYMLEVGTFLGYGADLFLRLLAMNSHAQDLVAYSCEDFFALELVQLRRRLLEVEPRLVTGSCHVCAGTMLFVRNLRSKKVGERPPPRLKLLPLAINSALADAWDDHFRGPRASHRGSSFSSLVAFFFHNE